VDKGLFHTGSLSFPASHYSNSAAGRQILFVPAFAAWTSISPAVIIQINMIQNQRILSCNRREARDRDYVLYWMQSAQRSEWNHALEYAIRQANERKKPAVAVFGLTADYPEANLRPRRLTAR
jgi:hypothetical protein